MRILCVTSLFPNPWQPGKGTFNCKQLRLMSRETPVRVIAPVSWIDALRALPQRKPRFCDGAWREWEGVDVAWCRYYYTPRTLRRLYGLFFENSIRKLFLQTVTDFRPDLVYACWPYPDGWAACRLARECGLPVVLKVHGSDLFALGEYPARKPGTAAALRGADAVVGVGQVLCDRAVELGAAAEQCHVVHEGIDPQVFYPGDRQKARRELGLSDDVSRLLFIGNLVPVKNVSNLIEACRLLRDEGRQIEADIIGEGPLRGGLRRQIERAGLSRAVRLRGWKTASQLPAWYRAADMFVLPSDSEGFPNVLVEAAACGTPIVSTAVGCIPEIAHMARIRLVPPADAPALARGIRAVLADSPERPSKESGTKVPTVADGVERTMQIFSQVCKSRQLLTAAALPLEMQL